METWKHHLQAKLIYFHLSTVVRRGRAANRYNLSSISIDEHLWHGRLLIEAIPALPHARLPVQGAVSPRRRLLAVPLDGSCSLGSVTMSRSTRPSTLRRRCNEQ